MSNTLTDRYEMNYKKRPTAIIFNHESFDDDDGGERKRAGTNKDRDDLKATLESLQFDVRIENDQTKSRIMEILDEVADDENQIEADCLLVAVMTHGRLDELEAFDIPYRAEELWLKFTADEAPYLVGKPKIFLIQACRGNGRLAEEMEGVEAPGPTRFDGVAKSTIPTHADIIIFNSTVPHFVSWRDKQEGSPFIQSFCGELGSNANHGEDFLSITTKVAAKVAFEFETKTGKKQMPCITSTLTKKIFFKR